MTLEDPISSQLWDKCVAAAGQHDWHAQRSTWNSDLAVTITNVIIEGSEMWEKCVEILLC